MRHPNRLGQQIRHKPEPFNRADQRSSLTPYQRRELLERHLTPADLALSETIDFDPIPEMARDFGGPEWTPQDIPGPEAARDY